MTAASEAADIRPGPYGFLLPLPLMMKNVSFFLPLLTSDFLPLFTSISTAGFEFSDIGLTCHVVGQTVEVLA